MNPIEDLMKTTLESIADMIDVNTVVGEPVTDGKGSVVIPVSRVSVGFAAGGGEMSKKSANENGFPFAGGSGAGITIRPEAFLTIGPEGFRVLPAKAGSGCERLIDLVPQLLRTVRELIENRERF